MATDGTGTRPHARGRGLVVASYRLPLLPGDIPVGRGCDACGAPPRTPRRGSDAGAPRALVTALAPVLRRERGTWVGCPTEPPEPGARPFAVEGRDVGSGYAVAPVPLSPEECRGLQVGLPDAVLWPLCHGFPTRCRFDGRLWQTYRRTNRRFAGVIQRVSAARAPVWVHDHHLMEVALYMRARGRENPVGYFHSIPFP
ncbi:MAG TPA: trehalose-6-phosphate synthase, partial [Longimicrobiales bacterium]|nr:trehalose-6-phosphate synthase [Longimicrobiales bacterium]